MYRRVDRLKSGDVIFMLHSRFRDKVRHVVISVGEANYDKLLLRYALEKHNSISIGEEKILGIDLWVFFDDLIEIVE